MTLPTQEQYLGCSAKWTKTHKDIRYTLSHHGVSEYAPQGTWCFYIHLLEPMFVNEDDFKVFDLDQEIIETFGSFRESYDYYKIPDYGFHGGITFYKKHSYIDRDGNKRKHIEIGCDYAHLWDSERGYSDGFEDVSRDAVRVIDKIIERNKMKSICCYSGKIDTIDNFYTAKNGCLVHNSKLELFEKEKNYNWLPID